jgi:superfamily II DNA or RNA helicase
LNKIIIRHSSIVINDYKLGDCPKLEYFFRLFDPVCHKYYFKGIEYIEEESKLIIPRGIDIYFIENLFNEEPKLDKTNDKYSYFDNPIMIKSLPRDEVQKEALRFILGEGEYSYTKNKSQLSVNLNTGAGKTYLTVAAIAYWCIRTAIITNSIGWLEQWNKRLIEYTDMKEDEIYLISGSGSIARLLNGMKDLSKIKVYLISHDTIKSYGDKYGWDKVTELFKLLEIGLKVYDEAHLYFDNICRIDYYTNTYKTIYLTATPARSDREENDIYQLYFKK